MNPMWNGMQTPSLGSELQRQPLGPASTSSGSGGGSLPAPNFQSQLRRTYRGSGRVRRVQVLRAGRGLYPGLHPILGVRAAFGRWEVALRGGGACETRRPAPTAGARLVFRNLPKREPAMSALTAAAAHALCFAGLAAGHALAGRGALISNPALALRLLVVCEAPVVIAVFSYLRRDPRSCSFFKAAARGLIGLPIGAFLNAFGAIVLGAPVGIKYWMVTIYWSLLMSLFTFVPAACVFGGSKIDWQNVLSHSIYFTPTDVDNYMISAPCHGAVLGAWLGAWPMPLDWERPWQEWPICVAYGAIAGRLVGMAVSLFLIAVHKRSRSVRAKTD